jgi:hypothetical protein
MAGYIICCWTGGEREARHRRGESRFGEMNCVKSASTNLRVNETAISTCDRSSRARGQEATLALIF